MAKKPKSKTQTKKVKKAKKKPRLVLDKPAQDETNRLSALDKTQVTPPKGFVLDKPKLVSVYVPDYLAAVFEECTLGFGEKQRPMHEIIEELVDLHFLMPFLQDHVNPEQYQKAQTPESRCSLCIAFLKAMRGAEGYAVNVKFGPFIVCVPREDILDKVAAEDKSAE